MVRNTISGQIVPGFGDAKNWDIFEIRNTIGYGNLKKGTLNVELGAAHILRPDYTLRRENRKDRPDEDLYFERCYLVISACRVPALIARTSRNAWGTSVLEIMAEEMLRERYRLKDGDTLDVEVWVESCGAGS